MPFNYSDALVCDMVVPWEPQVGNGVPLLERFHAAGVTFVSVHPAGDRHGTDEALERIARAKTDIRSDPARFLLVNSVAEIEPAKRRGLLAVGLHMEGSNPFEGDPSRVEAFFEAGIRFVHPVFNQANAFGGGSADLEDIGLTPFGIKCIEAMDRLGIQSDGAHTGRRTTLEMMQVSTRSRGHRVRHRGGHGLPRRLRARAADEWRGTWMPWRIAGPETIPAFADLLVKRGYADADIAGIMGRNWLRAGSAWKA